MAKKYKEDDKERLKKAAKRAKVSLPLVIPVLLLQADALSA